MGYTHYWDHKHKFVPPAWETIMRDVATILNHVEKVDGVPLRDGCSIPDTQPEINENHIAFNGAGNDAHETFRLNRKASGFNFCKTARKPYDLAATAVLAYVQSVYPDHISCSSNGEADDWRGGVTTARLALAHHAKTICVPPGVETRA